MAALCRCKVCTYPKAVPGGENTCLIPSQPLRLFHGKAASPYNNVLLAEKEQRAPDEIGTKDSYS